MCPHLCVHTHMHTHMLGQQKPVLRDEREQRKKKVCPPRGMHLFYNPDRPAFACIMMSPNRWTGWLTSITGTHNCTFKSKLLGMDLHLPLAKSRGSQLAKLAVAAHNFPWHWQYADEVLWHRQKQSPILVRSHLKQGHGQPCPPPLLLSLPAHTQK